MGVLTEILLLAAVVIGGDCALYDNHRYRGANDAGVDGFDSGAGAYGGGNDVFGVGKVRKASKDEAEELMRSAKGKLSFLAYVRCGEMLVSCSTPYSRKMSVYVQLYWEYFHRIHGNIPKVQDKKPNPVRRHLLPWHIAHSPPKLCPFIHENFLLAAFLSGSKESFGSIAISHICYSPHVSLLPL